jgi:hypothetical protein
MVPRPVVPIVLVLALTLSGCGLYPSTLRPPTTEPVTPVASRTPSPIPTTAPQSPPPATVSPPARSTASPPAPTPARSPSTAAPRTRPKPRAVGLAAYGGLGTWIDIYDNADAFGPQAFAHPRRLTAEMARHGVRTLFLEAGSYRHPSVTFPAATGRLIRAAHAEGLSVVAWYLPLFRNVREDLAAVMRVLDCRTADGETYDGFALDIEAALVPAQRRIANFLRLSASIRRAVGPHAVLGAIIPSPLGLIRVPTYWPGFPYDRLSTDYDVIMPMSYFTFRVHGAAAVERYVRDNVEIIRRETGRPAIPVHVIGGIADDMTSAETAAFVRSALAERVFGASLYEFPRTSESEWRILSPLR